MNNEMWNYLDDEVLRSDQDGEGCLIMMDANSWLGSSLIHGDPHNQNQNGKLFENFLFRNPNLTVLNADKLCQGKITRCRVVNGKLEKSIIDFIIICEKLLPYFLKMTIDEEKLFSLTNFSSKRKGEKAKTSDHNSQIAEFQLIFKNEKEERKTFFNFGDHDSMKSFKTSTSNTTSFTDYFKD